MPETLHKGPAPANLQGTHRQPVGVEGYQGEEVDVCDLSSIAGSPGQEGNFNEVYLVTDSGNQYAILQRRRFAPDGGAPNQLILVNRKANLDRMRRGEPGLMGTVLSDDVAQSGELRRGQYFSYGEGYTTNLARITVVDTNTRRSPEELSSVTGGRTSEVMSKFWQELVPDPENAPKERGPGRREELSGDDEVLVGAMLYPDRGSFMLYHKLVGEVGHKERQPWSPEAQRRAKVGMRELFETALEPIKFKEDGIEGARAGLYRAQHLPQFSETMKKMKRAGRQLEYQGVRDYSDLKLTGDFLHFGVNFRYSGAPDRLPYAARVYVTPKMEAVGHVAAEVIRRAREKKYEPYGKVWDETSNERSLSQRRDRILFFPRTVSQLKIIMETLKEVQAENPELFETDPPLLAEKSDIPGVGLAEEPPKVNGEIQSYNKSREDLLQEAWAVALEQIMGPDTKQYVPGEGGMILDARLLALREAVKRGDLPMKRLIETYRRAVRHLAPKHGVSPDNFARNL